MGRRLAFGKHAGRDLEDVPTPYLRWLSRQDWLYDDLADDVAAELRRRLYGIATTTAATPPPEIAGAVAEIVKTGFRRLALDRHPDRGGDHEDMVRLNQAVAWLLDHVRGGAA